jgi:DNA segregation ATPase FtsK/SpoIIIE-like protein
VLLGGAAHVIYFITLVWGGVSLRHRMLDRIYARTAGAVMLVVSVAVLLHVNSEQFGGKPHLGGMIGGVLGEFLYYQTGIIGANVVGVTFTLVGLILATELLLVRFFVRVRNFVHWIAEVSSFGIRVLTTSPTWRRRKPAWTISIRDGSEPSGSLGRIRGAAALLALDSPFAEPAMAATAYDGEGGGADDDTLTDRIRIWPVARRPAVEGGQNDPFDEVPQVAELSDEAADQTEVEEAPPQRAPIQFTALRRKTSSIPLARRTKTILEDLPDEYVYPKRYTRPSLDLFDPPKPVPVEDWSQELLKTSELLEETLATFGIEARVTDVTRGPTITRYELEPAPGIKVGKFLSLADDVALALKAHRVRVEAPIPGKGRVGIEVPNRDRESVVIRELLESREFAKFRGELALALGKDIAGDVVVTDLSAMPHLLVAGATGAGKTVCVKSLLASLLYTRTPEELQLMLIDPKMVELSIFNDIPHLITPVVTDAKKAASALNWLIVEMTERYRLFNHLKVRNIEIYNQSVENGEIEMIEPEGEDAESVDAIRKLPNIVCVIDELADLMMLARAEVEDAIGRLAQLARAVGIHLIIATQRPSVDVLTGVIKANFPCRISFQVSSRVDSRCILDEIGAERLIGRGDMLFLPAGQSKPTRIQGAFVSDAEMNELIAYLKTQAPPQYRDEIENFGKSKNALDEGGEEDDELFDDAVRIVLETKQASISMVQRRLRVGYTRAARLIDMMEMRGIVGPHSGSKAREILVNAPPSGEVA